MKIRKSIDGELVYTMRDISIKLDIDKYHIKNWIKDFELEPILIENRKWYFNRKQLIPFLSYLIYKQKLMRLKKEIQQWTKTTITTNGIIE